MTIVKFNKILPKIHKSVYIDPQSKIIGDVEIAQDTSVWPMVVIRGDVNFIKIGAQTNIQDGSILHVTHKSKSNPQGNPLILGKGITVGHGVILHACTIGDYCLIGMGAILMDKVQVEPHAMIGAGSLVTPGKIIKSGELWLGNPAKKVRMLSEKEIKSLEYSARQYVKLKNSYINQ
ncbi:MAG: gamma carbonic anhydrase family protein [Proteobacteria bacterium]|nr:gamma carbonic anhydrase family protein [Pseudomonadota bacterium]